MSSVKYTPVKRAALAKRVKTNEFVIKITFPFNQDDLQLVRTLQDRQYHSQQKCWSAPPIIHNIEALKKWGFLFDEKLKRYHEKMKSARLHVDKMTAVSIPGLSNKLYSFQKKGVAFIEAKNGRALVADEMGLGKTIQALAWLQLHPELRPVIIVCPASVKLNWEREILRWMTNYGKIEVLHGKNPKSHMDLVKIKAAHFIIINYDILSVWVETLKALEPKVLITDECHFYKSNKASRTKAVKRLAKGMHRIIALSGTPILNRPIEIYNAIKLIAPNLVPSRWEYAKRYCDLKHNGFGWNFNGASNTKELYNLLVNHCMIRRLKKDVLKELPDKIRSFTPMGLDDEKQYLSAEMDFINSIRAWNEEGRANNMNALSQIEGLKQLCVRNKLKQCIEWIRNFIETGEKLVVFAHHRFVIDTLMDEFNDIAIKVDGSVVNNKRQEAVDKFQTDTAVKLFVGNIQAAGIGITLTAASNVAFIELPWTPGELTQAEDRCHRIGQRDSVNVYYLLAVNTIEERIARLIDKKRKVLDSVLDGKATEQESLLTELINEYKT